MALATSNKKYFSDKPDFTFRCPTCDVGFLIPNNDTFKVIEPDYSKNDHKSNEWDPEWATLRFVVVCVCNKDDCGEHAFVTGSGRVTERYNESGHLEYYRRFSIKSFFPAPKLCDVPSKTPEKVEELLLKSFSIYWPDVSAAANALRASLEALLDELKIPRNEKNRKGSTSRMTLHRRLEVWGQTDEDYADLCLVLKEVGNLGSHGEGVKAQHYLVSLELYSYVLKQIFENNSEIMKKIAQKVRSEIKKSKIINA